VRVVRERAEALAVLKDPVRYTVDHPGFATAQIVGRSLLSVDGEEHARRRARFDGRFTVPEAWIRAQADALVAGLGDEAELRAEYAGPLAAIVMKRALELDHAVDDLLAAFRLIVAATVGDGPEAAGREAFERLGVDSDVAVALFGGIDTMEGMILNLVLHVLTGQAADVAGSLALDPAVVEVHRYHGDELVAVRLKDTRLPFAAGTHVCPAAQLARLEARVALEALLAREPVLTAPSAPEGTVFRKPVDLRVNFRGKT
jgi:cytochrome P450